MPTRRKPTDLLLSLALVLATLLLATLYARHRILWSDEILGWVLVTDPSFAHMLVAWRAGADGGGLLFYLLARAWLALFGHTVLAFRLFSAAGVAAAAVLTYLAARRHTRPAIALVSVALLWFTSDTVLWQIMQARFYGLLLAGVAAGSYLFLSTADQRPPARTTLLLTFLGHTLLVATHPFGVAYSAVLIAAMLAFDILTLRRPTLPLSALAGWWILLPSWQAMRNTAAVGKPHFWTTTPTLAELGATYSCWSLPAAIALSLTALLTSVLVLLRRPERSQRQHHLTSLRAPLLLIAALLCVPLLVWLASQRGTSLFVDRYLLPTVIPTALLLSLALDRLVPAQPPDSARLPSHRPAHVHSRLPARLFTVASLALAVWAPIIALVQYPGYAQYPGPDRTPGIEQILPRGIPIVVEPVDLFDQLLLYHQPPGTHYVTLLDWPLATGPHSLRGEVTAFHEMENWRKLGYFPNSIQDSATFLARNQPFAVLDVNGLLWFEERVRPNPAYTVELLGTYPPSGPPGQSLRLWLVLPRTPHQNHTAPDTPPAAPPL